MLPLPGTIIWIVVHVITSLGLNWVVKELGLINYSEVMTLYFIVLAGRYHDSQAKFSIAYKENPDLVEAVLRDQLSKDD